MPGLMAVLLLIPGQVDSKPVISHVQTTVGALGAARNDSTYLPGDIVHVAFDIAGLKLDEEGRYRVAAKLAVEDGSGKVVLQEDYGSIPPRMGILAGGNSRFAFRYVIPPDMPAGPYKAKLQLTDLKGKQEVLVEQAFKVSAPGFGLVRFQCGRGPLGQAETPPTGVRGEVLVFRVLAIGLSKGKEGQASLDFVVEVQDAQGKPLGKPQQNSFPQVNAEEPVLLQFELPLDQSGKFQVVLKATDKSSNRLSTITVPITVVE